MLRLGIVGLPDVGKSTLFNALTAAEAAAEHYPFCTVEPNVGAVPVPDPRLLRLAEVVSAEARGSRAATRPGRFFEAQLPGYRRTAAFWVMEAKREETRERRLTSLIAGSSRGERIPLLAPPTPRRGRQG